MEWQYIRNRTVGDAEVTERIWITHDFSQQWFSRMDEKRLSHLCAVYRDGLFEETLPFWIEHAVDEEYGGFLTALDRDGTIIDTDKSVWQQGRFTWLLGELYNRVEPREEWLRLAMHGAEFLDRYCFDESDGRMWFQVTREGRPIRKRRYAFSESFAAIAFGEIAQATGQKIYAEKAERAFRSFLDRNLRPDPRDAKFTDVRPTRNLAFPMIAIVTAQQLRESIDLADADEWINRSIDDIARFHLNEEIECVMETVGIDGQLIHHFDGRTLNPGHAIEGAWFIMNEGKYRADDRLIGMGLRMLDWMWTRGWDDEHGGLFYFVSVDDKPIQEYWHDMKFWWPHNETIIATLLAYHLTRDSKYADWHRLVHEWSYAHFPDRDGREWFGYLHRDGTLSSTLKGNMWKGPFHLPRMQLVAWRIVQELQSTKT